MQTTAGSSPLAGGRKPETVGSSAQRNAGKGWGASPFASGAEEAAPDAQAKTRSYALDVPTAPKTTDQLVEETRSMAMHARSGDLQSLVTAVGLADQCDFYSAIDKTVANECHGSTAIRQQALAAISALATGGYREARFHELEFQLRAAWLQVSTTMSFSEKARLVEGLQVLEKERAQLAAELERPRPW